MNPEDKFKHLKAQKADIEPKKSSTDKSKSRNDADANLLSRHIEENIKVDIRSRKEQFFDGNAKSVSSINDTGEFDVLPKHANFVTLIRGYVIVDRGLPTEKKFEIDNGVLASKTGAVDVYLDF